MRVAILAEKDDTFSGMCECSFATKGWPSEEVAQSRILAHKKEHEDGSEIAPLSKFRADNGLAVKKGRVFPEGAVEIEEED